MPVSKPPADPDRAPLVEVKLQVPPDLHRAFHRCLWIRVHETGCTPLQVMAEVIHDFLKKHGC